jgi:hypothetical protein
MRQRKPRLKVILEQVQTADAAERLLKAYEMLLRPVLLKDGVDKELGRDNIDRAHVRRAPNRQIKSS